MDDGGAHTWLATVDLNVSPQSHEELDPFLTFLLHFVFSFKRQKNHKSCLSLLIGFVNRHLRQNRLSRQQMKSPFTALKKKPFVSFLKICVQIGKLEKVLFPFSTCEGESLAHHLKTPSRKEKLAYPYVKRK